MLTNLLTYLEETVVRLPDKTAPAIPAPIAIIVPIVLISFFLNK